MWYAGLLVVGGSAIEAFLHEAMRWLHVLRLKPGHSHPPCTNSLSLFPVPRSYSLAIQNAPIVRPR